MLGRHYVADLWHCTNLSLMQDAVGLDQKCLALLKAVGLTAVSSHWHAFPGELSGVTGVVLLAESHLAIHTWPESGQVTLDIFVCNYRADNSQKAKQVLDVVCDFFKPAYVQTQCVARGAKVNE